MTSNSFFFFFNDTATTEIYTLSLHDALPISDDIHPAGSVICHGIDKLNRPVANAAPHHFQRRKYPFNGVIQFVEGGVGIRSEERFSRNPRPISYAVFCLKKKQIPLELIYVDS